VLTASNLNVPINTTEYLRWTQFWDILYICKTILNKVTNCVFINKYNYSNFRVLSFIYFSFPRPSSPTPLIQYKIQVVRREFIEGVAFEGRNPGIRRGL
jgi:hypothetical protein